MRITMVGNFGLWNKGTMGARALPMAKALVDRGHEVCIIVPPWDESSESGREYVLDGVKIANVKLPPSLPLLWHGLLAFSLFRRVWSEPSDIVHVFKPKAYAGLVGLVLWVLKALAIRRFRIVVDTDDWEGTGGWNEIETFPRPVKWFISWHERVSLRCCDAVTVASRTLELLAWSVGVPRDSVHYVPNGSFVKTDVQPLSPGSRYPVLTQLDGHPVVLLYTRFFEFRLERFVNLVRSVSQEIPSVRFLIVGKGLWGEELNLAAMLNAAGLAESVVFAGWINKDEIPVWLRLADIAIYPMDDNLLNRSKCPAKLIDLMCNGIPVVGEGVGQVAEYIEQNSSGILVESGDLQSFTRAIVALLQDDLTRLRLGEGARERIAAKFDWRRVVQEVEASYGVVESDIGSRSLFLDNSARLS